MSAHAPMDGDLARAFHQRLLDDLLLRDDWTRLDERLAPQHPLHQTVFMDVTGEGPAPVRLVLRVLKHALKNWSLDITDQLAEGDRVVTRFEGSADHVGDLSVFRASGRRVSFTGILESRMEEGRAAESWLEIDALRALTEAGLVRVGRLERQVES